MKLPIEESEFIPSDLQDIVCLIRAENPAAAARFVDGFKSSVELLSRTPKIGRARSDLGTVETRSWRVKGFHKYLIFYDVLPDRVRLLRVLHGARDLQSEFGK